MTIIDTHVHLYDLPDPAAALDQAAQAGVSDVMAMGVDLASNRRHLDLTACPRAPRVHVALGLHPGNITPLEIGPCLEFMRAHIHQAVAVGECGLDFWYKGVRRDEAKKDEQRQVFSCQLDLARDCDRPVVVHSRGAWRECLEMVRRSGVSKADFHWYSGPLDVLKDILDAGFIISASPALGYSPESRAAAAYAPLDRILIETDTPVAVNGPQGERVPSSPRDVWRTLDALAGLKGMAREAVLPIVNANARAFFNI